MPVLIFIIYFFAVIGIEIFNYSKYVEYEHEEVLAFEYIEKYANFNTPFKAMLVLF